MVTVTFTASQSDIDNLQNALERVLATSPEAMTREGELGEFNFKRGLPLFQMWHDLVAQIKSLPWTSLPPWNVTDMAQALAGVEAVYGRIRGFRVYDPQQPNRNPQDEWRVILDALNSTIATSDRQLMPIINRLHTRGSDLSAFKESLQDRDRVAQEHIDRMATAERQAREMLESIKQSTQVGGAAKYAGLFDREARNSLKVARGWLISGLVFIAVGLLVAVKWNPMTLGEQGFLSSPSQWHLLAIKLLLVSTLIYAAVWCTRNYSAHRHNYVVSRHRQNALSSFEAFAQSAAETATKDAVLLQATRCIFEHQASGYLGKGGANQAQTILTEVFERFPPKAPKT